MHNVETLKNDFKALEKKLEERLSVAERHQEQVMLDGDWGGITWWAQNDTAEKEVFAIKELKQRLSENIKFLEENLFEDWSKI